MPAGPKDMFFLALVNSWGFIVSMAPYIIAGILVAAVLNTFVPLHKPAKLLQKKRWWMLPVSGLLGIVSPACTYGTVPLFVEMIKNGAPMAPAATFLVASSLVNPQIFALTAGALGMRVAVAQALASLVFAIGVGMIVGHFTRKGVDIEGSELRAARKAEEKHPDMHGHHHKHDMHSGDNNHDKHRAKHHMMRKLPWPRRLGINILDLTEFIGFYFVLGAVVAMLAAQFIPSGFVIAALGQGKWWAVPFAAVVSIPTYICGGGTIPFLKQAQTMGMSMGAVLAFLIAGPATRVTALTALAVIFKKRAVLIYVILLLAFAVVLGMLLGPFVQLPQPDPGNVAF